MKHRLIYIWLFFFGFYTLKAQTAYNMGNNGSISNACGGLFYDSGGPGGNYGASQNFTETFCAPPGQYITFNFTAFNTESGFDFLKIYNGPTTASPLFGNYSGTNAPTFISSSIGGCITFSFTSDGSVQKAGWTANIVCSSTPPPPPPPPPPGSTCSDANPFCTGTNYTFPNTTGNTTGLGAVDCLFSTPNPVWYFMKVLTSGNLSIAIAQVDASGNALDVDFDCFGPFTDMTSGCASIAAGTATSVDCSYSASNTETCTVNNAVTGQYYALLLTNFSNDPGTISFGSQSNSTGATDCNIVSCGVTATNTGPYCVGQTITLNATTTNTTATTYSWTGPSSFSATGQNVTIPNSTLAMGGTYSVTGTTSGTVTCLATTTVVVSANTPPVVNSSTICAGGTAALTASGSTTYTWSTSATTSSISVSPASTTVYTVTGSVGTCSASNTSTVTILPNPTVNVNAGMVCGGASATLTATGATNYSWNPTTGLSPTTGGTVVATPTATTIYTVSGTVGTCSAIPVTTTVTVNPAPNITATSNSICVGASAPISASGAVSYTWSPSATLGGLTTSSTTATPTLTTTYSVSGTDANGCIGGTVLTVTVYALPVFTASAPPVCVGQQLVINITPGFSNYSFPTIPTNTTSVPIIIPNAVAGLSGSYNFIVTDIHGCNNFGSVTVTVNSPPTITALASPVCVSSTGTLIASGAGINGTYTWNPTTNLNPSSGNQVFVTPTSTASITYTVTGQDANGCSNSAILNITPNKLPLVSIMPDTLKGCMPQCTTTYTAITNNALTNTYNWNFGAGQTSTAQNPQPCFATTANQIVKLTLTDANGCVNTATATVFIYPIPTADFDYLPKPVTILTPDVHFNNETYNALGGNIIYHWNFGDLLTDTDTSVINSPSYLYQLAGTYSVSLIATSANGCIDTIIKNIVVEPDYALYVPNAFTPNGDGKNEVFKATGEGIVSFTMNIFDRWGNNIFTSSSMDTGWNGSRHNKGGDILMQDVYVWKIDLQTVTHQGKTYTGTVTLLK